MGYRKIIGLGLRTIGSLEISSLDAWAGRRPGPDLLLPALVIGTNKEKTTEGKGFSCPTPATDAAVFSLSHLHRSDKKYGFDRDHLPGE